MKTQLKSVLLAALLATWCAWAQAQPGAPIGHTGGAPDLARQLPVRLSGQTLGGQPFDMASLRGKVVLVVFWSTSCAVCRDKMPELRANYEGWRGKPFEMVLVSRDRRLREVDEYEQIIKLTVPQTQRFPQLWAGQTGYADSFGPQPLLPATFIVDKNGQVQKSFIGRIPAEAWDEIADLL